MARRQTLYEERQNAAGLCAKCARACATTSRRYCARHLESTREYDRDRKRCRPWRRGGPGRPPYTIATLTIEKQKTMIADALKPYVKHGVDRVPKHIVNAVLTKIKKQKAAREKASTTTP